MSTQILTNLYASDILKSKIKLLNLIFIEPDTLLHTAVKIMHDYDISYLPVLDKNTNVGSIDEKLLIKLYSKNIPLNISKASDYMQNPFIALSHDSPAENVIKALKKNKKAVLITEKEKFIGIITPIDILHFFINPDHKVEFFQI